MPFPALFVPCQTPSVDLMTNRLSAIFIIEDIKPIPIDLESLEDFPPGVKFFIEPFSFITLWSRESGDDGKTFHLRITLTSPDGRETVLTPEFQFTMTHAFHRVMGNTVPLLGRLAGPAMLKLYVREQEGDWEFAAKYPVIIDDLPASPSQDARDALTNESGDDKILIEPMPGYGGEDNIAEPPPSYPGSLREG